MSPEDLRAQNSHARALPSPHPTELVLGDELFSVFEFRIHRACSQNPAGGSRRSLEVREFQTPRHGGWC